MEGNLFLGLFIIALGSFCQSSSYVPINKIKKWSWESFWIVQGVFAWLIFAGIGAWMAVPEGESLISLYASHSSESLKSLLCGALWGIGGLTFGLSMRYLGVALGQSIALGTCAGLGTILGPLLMGQPEKLTTSVITGVVVTLVGIAIIGVAGAMKAASLSEEEKKKAVKDFNFSKGIIIALLCGLMSACFAIGLDYGKDLYFTGENGTDPRFTGLPATFLITLGGFLTNAIYCFYQNTKNHTWGDYAKPSLYLNNVFFCALAGLLWYCQFFGKSIGGGYITDSDMLSLSWCILMALNVVFSNVWGIILKEWKGCSGKTILVLVVGLLVLIVSAFIPVMLK